VERESLGGICLNWGCIPTKSLLKSAQVFDYLKHAEDYGLKVEGSVKPDFEKVIARSRGVADGMSKGVQFLLKKNKIAVNVLGFDNEGVQPQSINYYNPTNVTVVKSYVCDYLFNYTLSPKYAWCYKQYGTNSSSYKETIFSHSFESGNLPTKTIYWDEIIEKDYVNVAGAFDKVNYDFGDMDVWYVKKNFNSHHFRILSCA
jgi:hypothetical protein